MYRILCRILPNVKDLMLDLRNCVGSYAGTYQFCSIFFVPDAGIKM